MGVGYEFVIGFVEDDEYGVGYCGYEGFEVVCGDGGVCWIVG